MNCQDWKEIKIGGGKINYDKNKKFKEKETKHQNLPGNKILKKLDEEDIVVLEKVTIDTSKLIEQKRNKCGLSQKELAMQLNIQVTVIKDLESGTGINNKGLNNKINKFLDNKIKKIISI